MTTFLLRRKKDSKLDGKNLIELPEKKVELCKLEFSQEERDVYHMVRGFFGHLAICVGNMEFDRIARIGRTSQPSQVQSLSARGNRSQVRVYYARRS